MSRIMIVDDEQSICWSLKERLKDQGHQVQVAASVEKANKLLDSFEPEILVLDIRLPGQDGLSAIPGFRQRFPKLPIIVMTAFGDLQTVVDAMSRGAFEYLVKPFELNEFLLVVDRAIQTTCDQPTHQAAPAQGNQLIGAGPAMQFVFKQIALVAPTEFPVLITGETGTGKELVAEAIHRHSHRRSGPFIRVSLASLSPSVIESELFGHGKGAFTGATEERRGLFELAENGTIFLDEIGEIPPEIQVKLLRILESHSFAPVGSGKERETNARLIAATNRNLETMLVDNSFRQDLYHRLKVFSIELPPLRDRIDDLRLLVEYFIERHSNGIKSIITNEFWGAVQNRAWPGNIRELRNAVDHAIVLARGGPIAAEHLPPSAERKTCEGDSLTQLERAIASWVQTELGDSVNEKTDDLYRRFTNVADSALFKKVLSYTQQNRTAAAKILGLDRATLRNKLGTSAAE